MRTHTISLYAAIAAMMLLGCATEDREPVLDGASGGPGAGDDGGTGGGDGGGDDGDGGGDDGGGDGGDDGGGDGGDDGGVKYDVDDGMGDGGGDDQEGCTKVDFLFVIDNSVSMTDEQQNLINSFPSFIGSIENNVAAQDYHILVTDMDGPDKWIDKYNKCDGNCMGEEPTKTCSLGTIGIIQCGDLWNATPPTTCDGTLGAGRVYSKDVPPNYCPIDGGKRYLTESQTNLDQTFECVSSMGAWGGGEFGMQAMLEATSAPMNGPGGCNEGFLRDDAVLVVTVISDEEDFMDSPGDPASWKADLLARKGGNETAVVVLGLVGDTALPNAVCPPDSIPGSTGGEDSPRLREFVESFGSRGFLGSVCEADYGPFFQQAVDVIDTACDEYVPEG